MSRRGETGTGAEKMYERLTWFIPAMEREDYGRWVRQHGDGSPGNPEVMPFVIYDWHVRRLEDAVLDFADDHREERVGQYDRILEKSGITWSMKSMKAADVSALDGRTVYALLLGAFRAERFCDGAVLEFCESGCMLRWLRRLKEIDELKISCAG